MLNGIWFLALIGLGITVYLLARDIPQEHKEEATR